MSPAPAPVAAGGWRWALLAAGTVMAVILGLWFRSGPLLEAWLLAFIGFAGLAAGSLGLLMIGHLLGGYWLNPVRSELEAAALTMPLAAILALPLIGGLEQLFPWASLRSGGELPWLRRIYLEPSFVLLRGGAFLAIWCALVFWIARPGEHRTASALGLTLLMPTAALAGIDWVMSREPRFWSSLFGFAFAASQLLPALALAVLVDALRPERPDAKRLRSLERALITLALLTLWLWFVQFLVIWMANLPDEVSWYLVRHETFGWLMLGVVVPAMMLGILLLIPPGVSPVLMIAACILLLVQHAGHMVWLVRPAAGEPTLLWADAIVLGGLCGLWTAWLVEGLRRRPNVAAREPEGA